MDHLLVQNEICLHQTKEIQICLEAIRNSVCLAHGCRPKPMLPFSIVFSLSSLCKSWCWGLMGLLWFLMGFDGITLIFYVANENTVKWTLILHLNSAAQLRRFHFSSPSIMRHWKKLTLFTNKKHKDFSAILKNRHGVTFLIIL